MGQFVQVSEEKGDVTGVVACSVFGRDPYLHDLEYWGDDPTGGPLLMRRGMRWCSEKAHALGGSYYCNVGMQAPNVFDMCMKKGEIHQVVFKISVKEAK